MKLMDAKVGPVIGLGGGDAEERRFLKLHFGVTEDGWYYASNQKCTDILLKMFGLENDNVNPAPTPGDASVVELKGAKRKLAPTSTLSTEVVEE